MTPQQLQDQGAARPFSGSARVGHALHASADADTAGIAVEIYGHACVMHRCAGGWVVQERGEPVATAPSRFLVVARAAIALGAAGDLV